MSTTDTSPLVVLVPVKLDAFVFNRSVCDGDTYEAKIAPITQPNYTFLRTKDFLAQSDILPHVDLHLSTPPETNSRLTNLGTGQPRKRTGVYLHWMLPRAYRRGTTKNPEEEDETLKPAPPDGLPAPTEGLPDFPAVPTRWLVIRHLHQTGKEPSGARIPEIQAWVVESDKPYDINFLDKTVDLEVDVSPFIKGGNNSDADIERQAEVFIGGKTAAKEWTEPGKQPKLTLPSSSNPLFADYQPHNSNVFSMLDRFEYGDEGKQLTEATASYYVLGWHSSAEEDILNGSLPKAVGRLRHNLMELASLTTPPTPPPIDDDRRPARLLCHGAMYEVKWNDSKKPGAVPADDHSLHLNSGAPVAVGTTVLDALQAWIQANAPAKPDDSTNASETSDDSTDKNTRNLCKQLRDIYSLPVARDDGVDAQREAADILNNNNYDRVKCGTNFHLAGTNLAGENDKPQPPSPEEIKQLAELNKAQYALDLATRTSRKLRWDMFSFWWKYVSSGANINAVGSAHNAEHVNSLSKQLQVLLKTIEKRTGEVEKFKKDLPQAKPGAMPNAFQHKDPTLLVTGINSGWPHDFLEIMRVRLDSQIITGPDLLNPWKDFIKDIIILKLPNELQDSASALVKEFVLLPPTCTPPPPPPPSPPLPEGEFYPLYHETIKDEEGNFTDNKSSRDRWQNTQPWFPLFLEWEVEYTHIPFKHWKLEERLSTTGELHTPKLQYGIKNDDWMKDRTIQDSRNFSGRTLILPQATFSLKSHIKRLFESIPQETLDTLLPDNERIELLKKAEMLPLLSTPLAGFTDHLVTKVNGTHIKPNDREHPRGISQEAGNENVFTSENLSLIGQESDLTPYGSMVKSVNNYSLFKPVTHGRFKFTKLNIIDKFGQAIHAFNPKRPTGPRDPDEYPLYPCVSEFYSRMSDDKSLEPDEFVYVPPQINQYARLNCCFVVEDKPEEGGKTSPHAGWRPVTEWDTDKTNPIWGWVLLNAPDNSIQLFQASGVFYCAVSIGGSKGTSRTPTEPLDDITPSTQLEHLAKVLGELTYLTAFIKMINEATSNGASAPTAYAQFVSSLVGKPFALANMGWSLELAVDAYTNQSTLTPGVPEPGLNSYEFPIKFGDQDQIYDGLAGYFDAKSGNDHPNLTEFFTYTRDITEKDSKARKLIVPDNYPRFTAHWISPFREPKVTTEYIAKSSDEIYRERNAKLRVFGAILDPFTAVHAYSSFLPTVVLQLPPFTWQSAMSKMSAFFHLGPLLVPTAVPTGEDGTVPIPALGFAEWFWWQPYLKTTGETAFLKLGIEKLEQRPRFEAAPYTAIEGYLELKAPISATKSEAQKDEAQKATEEKVPDE
ncbi:hypothetical protein Q9L58_009376 [Maublancomyces gigas]|uniref:Uncharacterized protein n=1 Tax=Discina gigas TaxID=1032678 RepID=A0ABR3G717_9PEZI